MNYLEINRDKIFQKYSKEELLKDINNFINGKGRLYKVLNHFFEEEIWKCAGKKTKISPYEALQDSKFVQEILNYINNKPNFFTSQDEIANVKSYMRNSSSRVRKVANFPVQEARRIYNKYNNTNKKLNCLDTSAGFGSRMSATVLDVHNYYGIDPNPSLFKKLLEYRQFLYQNELINGNIVNLYKQGSEDFIPDLIGKIDVSFTSPPYFNLETYGNDNAQSTSNYNNYANWVRYFVIPTVNNTIEYLKSGGIAMINVKNINKKETCYDDFLNAFYNNNRVEFVEIFDMKVQSQKQYGMKYDNKKGVIMPKEPVMVFKRK